MRGMRTGAKIAVSAICLIYTGIAALAGAAMVGGVIWIGATYAPGWTAALALFALLVAAYLWFDD